MLIPFVIFDTQGKKNQLLGFTFTEDKIINEVKSKPCYNKHQSKILGFRSF